MKTLQWGPLVPQGAHDGSSIIGNTNLRYIMELQPHRPVVTVGRGDGCYPGPLPVSRVTGYTSEGLRLIRTKFLWNAIHKIASRNLQDVLPNIASFIPALDMSCIRGGKSCGTHTRVTNSTRIPPSN